MVVYVLRPTIQLKATMEAMKPTRLKNYVRVGLPREEHTAIREYALSSSGLRNEEKIRRRFGNYSQIILKESLYHCE
jgi:hypothetical protein